MSAREKHRMRHVAFVYAAAALCLLVAGFACATEPLPPAARTPGTDPAHAWAAKMEVDHLDNLHRVDAGIFRGAQPDEDGFRELHKLGIKTVVNLRALHSDDDEVAEAGLKGQLVLKHIGFNTWHPEKEDIETFLDVVLDPANQPIFIHCQHGADRTGTMCAIYRIVVNGWDREAAIDEMAHGDFGFHPLWQNLIDFLRNDITDEDIARWRARVAEKRR